MPVLPILKSQKQLLEGFCTEWHAGVKYWCLVLIPSRKLMQGILTIFADRTTLLWFIDWVDTLRNCAVCYNTVNFIAGLTATPFTWRGLGTNLRLAPFLL